MERGCGITGDALAPAGAKRITAQAIQAPTNLRYGCGLLACSHRVPPRHQPTSRRVATAGLRARYLAKLDVGFASSLTASLAPIVARMPLVTARPTTAMCPGTAWLAASRWRLIACKLITLGTHNERDDWTHWITVQAVTCDRRFPRGRQWPRPMAYRRRTAASGQATTCSVGMAVRGRTMPRTDARAFARANALACTRADALASSARAEHHYGS
jgi:hypothetical protein